MYLVFSIAVTNSWAITAFVITSTRLYFLLIHIISSMVPSLFASHSAFTYNITLFSVVDAFLVIIILNMVSLFVF